MSPSRQVRHAIHAIAVEYQQPPNLIAALVRMESGFNPLAIGDNGDSYGLGQYNWAVREWSREQAGILFDSRCNLRYCLDYFCSCLESTGMCVDDALSAYNQGIAGWTLRGKELNRPYWESILAQRDRYDAGEEFWDA